MPVEEVQHRRPVVLREGMTVVREVHPEPIGCAKERVGGSGADDRLPHGVR